MAKKDTGKAYVEGILKYVPEAQRETVREALMQEQVLEAAAEGVMLKADYSRNFDALAANKKQLDDWYASTLQENTKNQEEADKYRALVAAGKVREDGDLDDDDDESASIKKMRESMLTKEEGQRLLTTVMADSMKGMATLNHAVLRIALEHQKRFGEIIDPQALLQHAQATKATTVEQAYNSMFAEKLQKYEEQRETKAAETLRAKIKAEVLAEMKSSGTPYPIGLEESQESGGSALGGLKSAADQFSAESAAADYERRVNARGAQA